MVQAPYLLSVSSSGYFEGKRRAEAEVLSVFGPGGVVLRPGFIYGTRDIGRGLSLPLGVVGRPLRWSLQLPGLKLLEELPGMRAVFAPPVDVQDVALVAAAAAAGRAGVEGVVAAGSIAPLARSCRVLVLFVSL